MERYNHDVLAEQKKEHHFTTKNDSGCSILHGPTSNDSLELCHYNLNSMRSLQSIRHLRSLRIVAQDIKEISSLEECRLLEHLWICECQVDKIQGLSLCTELICLYLYGNKISEIEGLDALEKLEKLWLFDNEITQIRNISNLKSLEELHLANNKISLIQDSISWPANLQILNLAGNKLSCFKDIANLELVPHLTTLSLQDYDFADNPICKVSNYKTLTIHLLNSLNVLDGIEITSERRRAISMIFSKKEMYYNCKIQSVRSNVSIVRNYVDRQCRSCFLRAWEVIKTAQATMDLLTSSKEIQTLISDASAISAQLYKLIGECHNELKDLSKQKEKFKKFLAFEEDLSTCLLLKEMETGGNIYVEEVDLSAVNDIDQTLARWLKHRQDFEVIQVLKVENKLAHYDSWGDKVNNRPCFAYVVDENEPEIVWKLLESYDASKWRHCLIPMDQITKPDTAVGLVLILNSDLSTEDPCALNVAYMAKLKILQHPNPTFFDHMRTLLIKNQTADSAQDLESKVQKVALELTNVIPLTTLLEPIQKKLCKTKRELACEISIDLIKSRLPSIEDISTITSLSLSHLNIKRFLPLPVELQNIESMTLSHNNLEDLSFLPSFPNLRELNTSFNDIVGVDFAGHAFPKLRTLIMMNNRIKCLETLFELGRLFPSLEDFDCRMNMVTLMKGYRRAITQAFPNLRFLDGEISAAVTQQDISKSSLFKHSSCQKRLLRPLNMRTKAALFATSRTYTGLNARTFQDITLLELDDAGIRELPDVLKRFLVHVRWLSLRCNFLRDISMLSFLPRLCEVDLSNNRISSIDCLSSASKLTRVDIGRNQVQCINASGFQSLQMLNMVENGVESVKWVAALTELTELYLDQNMIPNLWSLLPLCILSNLSILSLVGNPARQAAYYRSFTIFRSTRLKILDGLAISEAELLNAGETFAGTLTPEILADKLNSASFDKLSELDLRNCKLKKLLCFNSTDFPHIQKLLLDGNNLTDIDTIPKLPQLRVLSMNSNRVVRFNFDEKERDIWPHLQELYLSQNCVESLLDLKLHVMGNLKVLFLDGNKITKIEGLQKLRNLRRLVLDKNLIKQVDVNSFVGCSTLVELSLAENRIKLLSEFPRIPNLKILNLEGNRINDMLEIKNLNFDSITDISLRENPLCKNSGYRHSMVYHFCCSSSHSETTLPHLSRSMDTKSLRLKIDGIEVSQIEQELAQQYHQQLIENSSTSYTALPSILGSRSSISLGKLNQNKTPLKFNCVVLDGTRLTSA
ncbi:hypothetical protein BKA69DRAFT_1063007 [Paraphysoderma sedebokerense]|nr:hypothetical protein BKA69DRAFT_1063007 [Paraphysoderma sedebokerense]